ncbi:arsenate reductase/protein-tyrosine-phosphatase family protein [Corynebacterium guangdongense]|uniref:Protein-tyrosine-phosphatase n=1 Tax=Corynebacterium guangdongense TaxID=1783348 RepID=A0ABU1ZYB2_9CORY|nr:helix-turn-helix domain-containing protein [Corynebacterium guangdongense]MDR7329830.1 protein-tyrosine-phosphatase [Corynebacterium guangdongense]WJZ18393.1 Low molecular weight phosphotyrosine protein phosphatase [Corynebacterium guangdongense]
MNLERIGLGDRVARLAALADPVRLGIVDTLTLGDAAPVELQHALGVSSSLLAHHVRILEKAGFLTRHRSQADGRRSYLRLAPGAVDGLLPAPELTATRLVFVCTGNSARSQLATALWREASDIPGASAGTEPADRIAPGAQEVAARHGLLLDDRPRSVGEVIGDSDVIVTVCDSAHEELGGALHWSIPDPVAVGTEEAFDAAYEDLAHRVRRLAPRVRRVG